VTEAGFGADLGAEKFFDIKCAPAGLRPEAAVLVVTVRALRHHGGAKKEQLQLPDVNRVLKGMSNMEKHIENLMKFGMKPVVAINHFPDDSEEEIAWIRKSCEQYGVKAIVCTCFEEGGRGCTRLAEEITRIIERKESDFHPLYTNGVSIEEKIQKIATEIYGASGVEYAVKAKAQLKQIKTLGFDHMPVCMAKTPKSLSDDETKRGRPENFVITVREFEFASGAGFVIPLLGEMMRMPGLPAIPAAEKIDIDNTGRITGLS
jgi:formate--tetrahydrofolate ligase